MKILVLKDDDFGTFCIFAYCCLEAADILMKVFSASLYRNLENFTAQRIVNDTSPLVISVPVRVLSYGVG